MCNLINIHTYIHIMARMAGPDCAVLCNLINIQRERERESPLPRLIRRFLNNYT